MSERKKLLQELDNFDILTKIFVFGDPSDIDY